MRGEGGMSRLGVRSSKGLLSRSGQREQNRTLSGWVAGCGTKRQELEVAVRA